MRPLWTFFSPRFCGSRLISVTSKASKVRVVFQAARYSSSGWRGFDCKASCTKRSEEEEATTGVIQSGKVCGKRKPRIEVACCGGSRNP